MSARLKYEDGDKCLASWTCGYRKTSTEFAPEWMFTVARWQKTDGRKYWTVERDWKAREGQRPPVQYYSTMEGLKNSLRPDGKFLPTERCISNRKEGHDFVVVWKKRGESKAAALARGEEENRQRQARAQVARLEQERVKARLGHDFGTTVTIRHDQSGGWNLEVNCFVTGVGNQTRFSAHGCESLAAAAEQLCNWTKGLVIA